MANGNGTKFLGSIPTWVQIGILVVTFFGGWYVSGIKTEMRTDFTSTRLTNTEALAQSNKEEINKLKTNDEVMKEQLKSLCELPKDIKDLTNRITKLEEMLSAYLRYRGFNVPEVKK